MIYPINVRTKFEVRIALAVSEIIGVSKNLGSRWVRQRSLSSKNCNRFFSDRLCECHCQIWSPQLYPFLWQGVAKKFWAVFGYAYTSYSLKKFYRPFMQTTRVFLYVHPFPAIFDWSFEVGLRTTNQGEGGHRGVGNGTVQNSVGVWWVPIGHTTDGNDFLSDRNTANTEFYLNSSITYSSKSAMAMAIVAIPVAQPLSTLR